MEEAIIEWNDDKYHVELPEVYLETEEYGVSFIEVSGIVEAVE